jgi:hypothetical protein
VADLVAMPSPSGPVRAEAGSGKPPEQWMGGDRGRRTGAVDHGADVEPAAVGDPGRHAMPVNLPDTRQAVRFSCSSSRIAVSPVPW